MTWAIIAPTRPANAANPFDKAYRFDDLDELVRNTQERDMEVLITIWGTPKWANGGKTPNFLPTRMSDLTAFSRAVASRYSGRFAGIPFVRFYSIWNESNLQLFLAPQFDAKGRSVAPRNYAKLAAAAYAGIKAGNPSAKVAVGSTSSAGRDKPLAGKSATHSPGRFAQLVAAANPRLKFDAWAQHPYPVPANQKPDQKVKWPNVTLASFPRFEKSLDTWFKRKGVRIWITEYGHEVKQDGEPNGVSRALQATYAARARAREGRPADGHVHLVHLPRPSRPARGRAGSARRAALRSRRSPPSAPRPRSANARNAIFNVQGRDRRARRCRVVPARLRGRARSPARRVGFNVTVRNSGKLVTSLQPTAPFRRDATAAFRLTGLQAGRRARRTRSRCVANVSSGGGVS